MSTIEHPQSRLRITLIIALGIAFIGTCGLPYFGWWANPSLFDDDFLRVGSLRRVTLGEALFRPFNEHMAPLFEIVSWLAWVGAGRQVLVIPLMFQVASYIAFGSTVGLLAAWVWREVRSTTATLLAVALFCLSAVSAETVLWYSASSFQWAASATLAACLAASIASSSPTTRARVGWSFGSMLAALMAPAFSAIGILAGPLAALRILSGLDGSFLPLKRLGWSLLPMVGTAGYLLICEQFEYRDLISASVSRSFEPLAALWATVRAPTAVLVPALIGLPEQSASIPAMFLAGTTLISLILTLFWAILSRHRPLILVSLALIAGGYFSTYATRARPGDIWIFGIQRYHLFPQIGLIGLIVAAVTSGLRRFDAGPARGFFAGTCLAVLLAVVQYPPMKAASVRAFRYREQPLAIAATLHLEKICEREGITLPQVMTTLEPIQTPWYPRPWPFNPLLHLLPTGPTTPRIADSFVRARLIEALSAEDCECLFGGMDATRYAIPASAWPNTKPSVEAKPDFDLEIGQGGLRSAGKSPHEDFEVNPGADDAQALSLKGFGTSEVVEVWWLGEGQEWSIYRSFRWKSESEPRALPFDRIPHWKRGQVRRLRVIFRDSKHSSPGMIRFLR